MKLAMLHHLGVRSQREYGVWCAYGNQEKRINDTFFLTVFILQVSRMLFVANYMSLQFLGFAAVSGIVLYNWIQDGGLGGGVGDGTNGSNTGTSITLN